MYEYTSWLSPGSHEMVEDWVWVNLGGSLLHRAFSVFSTSFFILILSLCMFLSICFMSNEFHAFSNNLLNFKCTSMYFLTIFCDA